MAASFATYARDSMGKLAGFLTGWNYWLAWVMGMATESVAAGTYLHSFYSAIPIWIVAGIIIAIELIINVLGVLIMGEYEFVLSSIKIFALGAFIVIGLCAILGIGFQHPLGLNWTVHGGFFPHGGSASSQRCWLSSSRMPVWNSSRSPPRRVSTQSATSLARCSAPRRS